MEIALKLRSNKNIPLYHEMIYDIDIWVKLSIITVSFFGEK
jgi:hypothetical protein